MLLKLGYVDTMTKISSGFRVYCHNMAVAIQVSHGGHSLHHRMLMLNEEGEKGGGRPCAMWHEGPVQRFFSCKSSLHGHPKRCVGHPNA